MLDRFREIRFVQRANELDAIVAHAHELHPDALPQTRAVVPLLRDRDLIPRARPLLAIQDLADPASEPALVGLHHVTDDFVRAPLVWIEVPGAVGLEGGELRLDQRAGRLEVSRDVQSRKLGRLGGPRRAYAPIDSHVTSCGALRIGTLTLSTVVPSGLASCVDSPRRSSSRSLRRMPDWSSPSGGSSRPSVCRRMSSESSFQVIPRTSSFACPLSIRSTRESWMRRKIATSSSDGSRRSRPTLEKSMRTPCLSMSVCT